MRIRLRRDMRLGRAGAVIEIDPILGAAWIRVGVAESLNVRAEPPVTVAGPGVEVLGLPPRKTAEDLIVNRAARAAKRK